MFRTTKETTMKTYFMAAEIRNTYANVIDRVNVVRETSFVARKAYDVMKKDIAEKYNCPESWIFIIAFNSV
jgi:hypothetical protein